MAVGVDGDTQDFMFICHSWDKCPLVSSQGDLCCAPLGGNADVRLARALKLHSRSISWCRQSAPGLHGALQGLPIPWQGSCQAACPGCSSVEHAPLVLQAHPSFPALAPVLGQNNASVALAVGFNKIGWFQMLKSSRNNKTFTKGVYIFCFLQPCSEHSLLQLWNSKVCGCS